MSAWGLGGVNFTNANLTGIVIDGAIFEHATFDFGSDEKG